MLRSPLNLICISAVLIVGIAGVQFAALAVLRVRRGRLFAAVAEGGIAGVLMASAAAIALVGLNFYTYQRLTAEQPVASLSFQRLGPQRFRCVLHEPDRPDRSFDLSGDQWELEARVLTWKGPAAWFGLDSRYRLERLTGRYRDLDQARSALHTAYGLSPNDRIDLWSLMMRANTFIPWMDAYFGSAAYLPMADGAIYQVNIGREGLVARPVNAAAHRAVEEWH
jgi:hypothetical protein